MSNNDGGSVIVSGDSVTIVSGDGSRFTVNAPGTGGLGIDAQADDYHIYSDVHSLGPTSHFRGPGGLWSNLREYSAPGSIYAGRFQNSDVPAEQGSKTSILGLGDAPLIGGFFESGDVTHYFNENDMTILNITDDNHGLKPGIVSRTITVRGEEYVIITYGVGNGPLAGPNDWLSYRVWGANAAAITRETIYEEANGASFPDPREQHCFKSDTPIQMWPLEPSIKPRADGTYDEQLVLSKVWEKPICEIKVGDLVISYDDKGRIKPGPVTRTMQNQATHLLDFWNTGVTPGHAYYCADGKFKDKHVPLMDILRTDGAIMRADGTMIRAATNCEVGSMGDMMIHASATLQKPDGTLTEAKPGKVRFGTRIILPDGRHMSFMEMATNEGWRVSDDGYMVGIMKGEDGEPQEQKFLFPYAYGEELPKPEDYILARSKVTLEAIYAAGEWEQIGTRMPAPAGMVGLNTNYTSTLLQPSKPEPNIPPAFANHPDAPRRSEGRSMNRKQRKAMEAKQRKARKRLVS